ncbi:hypothetical protein pEaSNUABM29_00209 [Erwinia phage pEa_SNUABM_29]|nr:hypothetical protein pEaSNUABM29_00209 [Erwinia phage pEa_SNUABM_29]
MGLFDVLKNLDEQQEKEVITVARESISTEKEREYCMWVKPTEEGWNWLFEQAGGVFLDVIMPVANGKRRVRLTSEGKAVLTLKRQASDGRIEENSDIGFATGLTFYGDGNLAHLVRRLSLEPGELAEQGAKHWDIDMFFMMTGHPVIDSQADFEAVVGELRDSTSFGEWVKVELEVERFELTSIKDVLPFAVEDAIPGNPSNADDQEVIRNYWDNDTRI